MPSVAFIVPGAAVAQGSKRHVGGGRMIESSKALPSWRDSITWHAQQARPAAADDGIVFTGPVQVTLIATYARPKSHYGTGRNAATLKPGAPEWKASAPDADKIARAALDALTVAAIWRDDAQVVDLHVWKVWGSVSNLTVLVHDNDLR